MTSLTSCQSTTPPKVFKQSVTNAETDSSRGWYTPEGALHVSVVYFFRFFLNMTLIIRRKIGANEVGTC